MNVTDLRRKLRRSNTPKIDDLSEQERRKAEDRRQLVSESSQAEDEAQRIWLTPGERTLIEDLYLLDDK
ncbi:MAG: hypothetical protein HOO87_02475 [Methyloglobulus sp.]|nr:hypothetical protein [Methyloglobulus sp.]